MKRLLSLLLVLVMVVTMLPLSVFGEEAEDGSLPSADTEVTVAMEEDATDTGASADAEAASDGEAASGEEGSTPTEAAAERICEDGCILVGEAEHLDNGGECLAWISCTLTEGCEGMAGHEGECYVSALYADGCTLTVTVASSGSNGPGGGNRSVSNVYVIINDALYYIDSSGTVVNADGSDAVFEAGTYTVYYGPYGGGGGSNKTVYTGTVTVNQGDTSVGVSLRAVSYSQQSTADQYRYAESIYYNTTSFNHIHIRVAGSYVIQVNNQSYTAKVSNPSMIVNVNGVQQIEHTWTNTETYEWTYSANVSRSAVIEVILTLDLTYTADGKSVTLENVTVVYDNVNDLDKFIEAIAICDGVEGLDFVVSVADIAEEIQYYTVTYEWRVYNTDGTYTTLPGGTPDEPASTSGHVAGEAYAYDTEYVTGTSFYDYTNGLLYTFHGWDTYSHSSVFNVDPTADGYHALDDGDTEASNNRTVEITADTYIYGYWTVSELEPASAYISLVKNFAGEEEAVAAAKALWFRIDTGIDKDGDGDTEIDVDYSLIEEAGGAYNIPVYQYTLPFVFTEYKADVPGYTRTTTITVSGTQITGSTVSGDSVSVYMEEVYQGENVHLGTVTYTNTYTRNVGEAVSAYPSLTLIKTATDTGAWQSGVEFTLYTDADCTDAVAVYTTNDSGLAFIDFTGLAAGTYYLKETAAAPGYLADDAVYPVTLAASESVEELRWNETEGRYEFVQVTVYVLSVTVPEGSDSVYAETRAAEVYYRLHVYNDPIQGSLNVTKAITGMAEEDKAELSAVLYVHGPITRDADGSITGYGSTWTLTLDSGNGWSAGIENLPVGEYLIHESYAHIHGYTWTGVTYGELSTVVYNGITSGLFEVDSEETISLTVTNTYEEWTKADFYIHKVDASGNRLAGAEFTLYADEACTQPATGTDITLSAITGEDGYAHFENFDEVDTYYLKETRAPAGFYLDSTVYKVEITAADGAYTADIYAKNSEGVWVRAENWNTSSDLLTVTNHPVLGQLTLTKAFTNGTIAEGLTGVAIRISGPNGYSNTVELNNANGWSVTLEGLALGDYSIYELDANVTGYTWAVSYSSITVSLTEEDPGYTVEGTEISGSATITNTYTRNEEEYEIPTTLAVKKVDENGTALAGAVFTLVRLGADGTTVINSVSFTTGESGIVVFDLLSGFIVDGDDIDGVYILSETTAPAGYEATDTTWTVTITEDDGEIRVELNENKNFFENIWEWIVGGITGNGETGYTWAEGILTVENVRKTGSLTITKEVEDALGLYGDAVYTFTLDCSDDSFDRTFTLKAGEAYTLENIPWGTTYTLTEDTTGAAYTSAIADAGNGVIWADTTEITVTNTYAYTNRSNPLTLVKVDSEDNAKVIAGAGFTLYADEACTVVAVAEVFSDEEGNVALPVAEAGTYYLKETTTPEGYHPNDAVYVVTVEERAVVKDAGTADTITEIQLLIRVEGLTGTTADQLDYVYSVENTAIKTVVISVEKIWEDGGYHARPEAVEVTLYRDDEAYETVTLKEDNGWAYVWTGEAYTDEYTWTVDEASVPDGYTRNVEHDGNSWTITNTRGVNPVEVSVTKVWVASEGVVHPESVEVVLYRNGQAYDTVTLSADNDWSHTWIDLTDAYAWSVDEASVPEGYTKAVTVDGYDFTITNTKDFAYIDVSVTKIWYGTDVTHPTSVGVTLYRDGVEYDSVTLSAANNWTYTWEDLTDEFEWTVDEPSVPSGYYKTVSRNGYDFTITNTYTDNPKTGDLADLFGVGAMGILALMGIAVILFHLAVPRRKEEENR